MKRVVAVLLAAIACGRVTAAPCSTSGSGSMLERAATGLSSHQWCKMAPTIEAGASMVDLLDTCGDNGWFQNYAASMAYDPVRKLIWFWGTPHGGAGGLIKYDVAANTWYAISSDEITNPTCTASTCNGGSPWSASQRRCSTCDANHAYDSNVLDPSTGYLFVNGFGGEQGQLHRLNTSALTWSKNFTSCPDGGSTGAMAYWPTLGASGSFIMLCNSNGNTVYRYDLATTSWSSIGSTGWSPTYHTQIEYHPNADLVWAQEGNGGTSHLKLTRSGQTVSMTALGAAPSGRLGMTDSRCVSDSGSDDKFICWDMSENNDDVGDGQGWYEYDIGSNTWTHFPTLGINSMPNLYTLSGDLGSTPMSLVDIPELGVSVWLGSEFGGEGEAGMYVYKHTQSGDVAPASPLTTITVKETSSVGASGWPTTAVVPLTPGTTSATTGLRIWDVAAARSVPAQFEVVDRAWAADGTPNDNDIRHVAVHWQADVASAGTRQYQIANDSGNPAPAESVVVADNTPSAGYIQVTTGPIRFTMLKGAGFNILDTVWYDADGDRSYENSGGGVKSDERIISPSANHGGRIQACDTPSGGSCSNVAQYDSSLTPDLVTIEETGPMRAVVRVERYTRYSSIDNLTHGYVVRVYAYAGSPMVKIDYQLVNAATDDNGNTLDGGKWADPFYFDSVNLEFNLALSGSGTVKTGTSSNGVDSRTLDANGVEMAYTLHDNYALRYAGGGTNYSTCTDAVTNGTNDCDTAGFMDFADGTWGVQVAMRNMWEQWPSGFQATDTTNHNLQIQLWPDWSGRWHSGAVRGQYWLDDMQAAYKEVLLNFHGATPSNTVLTATARSFDRYPVPTLPTAWYSTTGVTLDMGGKHQLSSRLGSDTLLETNTSTMMDETQGDDYQMGWARWADYQAYRVPAANDPGDGPSDAAFFVATESPDDYWIAERWAASDLNIRAQWMGKDYTYAGDYAAMQLGPSSDAGSSNDHWRDDGTTESYPIANSGRWSEARDAEHFWFWHMQAYWFNYNLWIKDWFAWQAEFQRSNVIAVDEWLAERAIGNTLNTTWLAYRATGDVALLNAVASTFIPAIKPDVSPLCGRLTLFTGSSSTLEMGFLTRSLQSILREFRGVDWQRWANVFTFVSGYQEWNQHWGNWEYHPDDINGLCSEPPATTPSGTSWPAPDPVSDYYWLTGKTRFRTNSYDYVNDNLGGAPPYTGGYGGMASPSWDGSYAGRIYWWDRGTSKADSTPPGTPTGLSASLNGTTLDVNWSAPTGSPAYYYAVWAGKQIEECTTGCDDDPESTNTTNYRNWWAGTPGATTGTSIQFTGVNCSPTCYVGVAAFDAADNMSAFAVAQSGAGGASSGSKLSGSAIRGGGVR